MWTHKHTGVAASHGTAQFRSNPVPTKGFGPGGSHGAVGAGVGQQVKPRTCKAGGGWVGWITDGHKATSQQNPLKESPQHLARPVRTGGHTTLRPCGVPTGPVLHFIDCHLCRFIDAQQIDPLGKQWDLFPREPFHGLEETLTRQATNVLLESACEDVARQWRTWSALTNGRFSYSQSNTT